MVVQAAGCRGGERESSFKRVVKVVSGLVGGDLDGVRCHGRCW